MTCGPNEIEIRGLACIPDNPIGFVQAIYQLGLWLLASVGLLFMIIGGYYILVSRGDPVKLQKGKTFIFYSLAGMFLAILGFVFIEIIAGGILKIPGFNS